MNNKLILTSWSYSEGLIQAAVLPYLKMIADADPSSGLFLVTEEKDLNALDAAKKNEIKKQLQQYNTVWVPQQYYNFGVKKMAFSGLQFMKLVRLIFSKKIRFIHAFCTPAGSVGYALSKITGRKLVIDSYEPHAESMVENGTWAGDSKAFKLLWSLEKKQSANAHWCIGIASGMSDYAAEKWNVRLNNFSLRPMCVDLERFQFSEQKRNELREGLGWQNKIVAVYAGKFGGIYHEKEVFDFLEQAFKHWGAQFRILILSNQDQKQVADLYQHTIIPGDYIEIKSSDFNEMPNWLSVADFALTPVKSVPSKRYCSPIKDGEYWAMGLPVVISENISDDSDIIQESGIGAVVDFTDKNSFLPAIEKIGQLLQQQGATRAKVRQIAERYRNFQNAEKVYKEIYGKPAKEY